MTGLATVVSTVTIDGAARFTFPFPELSPHVTYDVWIVRTLRYPPDTPPGAKWPPARGGFALRPVDDFAGRLPAAMLDRGGVVVPMWRSDGLGIFSVHYPTPHVVRVLSGPTDAVTGAPPLPKLSSDPQNYFTVGPLLGVARPGRIPQQFVAPESALSRPLSERLTAAAGMALRISVHPQRVPESDYYDLYMMRSGIGPDKVPDPESPDWLDQGANTLYVNLVDATTWLDLTGEWPGHRPLAAADYADESYPWSETYAKPETPAETLQRLRTQPILPTDATAEPAPLTLPVRLSRGPAFGGSR